MRSKNPRWPLVVGLLLILAAGLVAFGLGSATEVRILYASDEEIDALIPPELRIYPPTPEQQRAKVKMEAVLEMLHAKSDQYPQSSWLEVSPGNLAEHERVFAASLEAIPHLEELAEMPGVVFGWPEVGPDEIGYKIEHRFSLLLKTVQYHLSLAIYRGERETEIRYLVLLLKLHRFGLDSEVRLAAFPTVTTPPPFSLMRQLQHVMNGKETTVS